MKLSEILLILFFLVFNSVHFPCVQLSHLLVVVDVLGTCSIRDRVTFSTEGEEISGEDLPVSLMMKRSFNQICIVLCTLFPLLRRI